MSPTSDAKASSLLSLNIEELNALGKDRWELSSSWTETQTAFPNLGDAKYVTGFQPNVRTQRVVLLFKRQIWQ